MSVLGDIRRWYGRRGSLGARGERLAAAHLRAQGYRILKKNVRLRGAEADLVVEAADRRTIVIVEVKTRRMGTARSARFRPETAVGAAKGRRLVWLSNAVARRYGWMDRPRRVDVVAIEWPEGGEPVIRHHVDAVRGR